MKRLTPLVLACLALFFGGVATAQAHVLLIRPDGQPVGGIWQRWTNDAKIPTIDGRTILMDASICQGALGCSEYYPADRTAILHATNRQTLYFELGHLFDYEVLTWHDRGVLSLTWGTHGDPWNNSFSALQQGREDGLTADFAAAYQACALGENFGGLASGDAPVIQTHDTCTLIRRFAKRS